MQNPSLSSGFSFGTAGATHANKPFDVGGFTYKGGVLVLTVRILP